MSESLHSTHWYRVSGLRPTLRDSAQISRHSYRGQVWYVVRNALTSRNHRFNVLAYRLISRMDSTRTVEEIWQEAQEQLADDAPTQDEMIRLLGQLHGADLIQNDILPSTVDMFDQVQGQRRPGQKKQGLNPFFLRLPLWDPDSFLERWSFLARPFLTRWMLLLWTVVMATAAILAIQHWSELSHELFTGIQSPLPLLLLWLLYPLVKILHEAGHAFAIKRWGGEVNEMGIVLLALTPIPYVEASSSAIIPEKQRRIAVAALGMAIELLLAALALFVWLQVEPGWTRTLAGNVILIGGISTLLFNGNPLLRYDGYYILADLLEIPNLSQRSTRYLGYLIQKHLFGIQTAHSPITAPGERVWFVLYGPLAFVYRLFVFAGLVFWVSSEFFGLGMGLALWGGYSLFIVPCFRTLRHFLDSPAARQQHPRIAVIAGASFLTVTFLLFILPMPFWTTTQGVVWLPEQSAVRCGTNCELKEVLVAPGQAVAENTPLLRGEDPFLKAEIALLKAELQELYAQYNGNPLSERVARSMLRKEMQRVEADLGQALEQQQKMLIRSPAKGNFVLVDERNLPNRFARKGELLGYIVAGRRPTIRAVVRQNDIALVRNSTQSVEIRLAENSGEAFQTVIKRIVPSAFVDLPSPALGSEGGGEIPVDPTDPQGLRALDTIFQIDLSLPLEITDAHIGGRVYVKFDLGSKPLAFQWYRSLRQLLLRKFYV